MAGASGGTRIDSASRVIRASRASIYRALTDSRALASWLPPKGMTGSIRVFERWPGGVYEMTLTYDAAGHAAAGKTSENADVVRGSFVELVPDRRVVQRAGFESDDPAFAGAMTITWSLAAAAEGTLVTVRCENVPDGIRPEDHDAGLRSSLENLAAYAE